MIEVMVAAGLFTVVLLSAMAMIESGRRFSVSTLEVTAVEDIAQQMLFRIERDLANGHGFYAVSNLDADLASGTTVSLSAKSNVGFPPDGVLLLEPGTAREERLEYADLLGIDRFVTLQRGALCTEAANHSKGAELQWEGLAHPIDVQNNPPPQQFDGIALEEGTPVFFRGDGTGFSYRVPVDPAGGNVLVAGEDVQWGAEIAGAATVDGWSALYWQAERTVEEREIAHDLNLDGDFEDEFEIGQIRRVSWDTTDPARREDVGLGPRSVLQERCNRGGDLDGDGFDDPIFLFDRDARRLHVRLFLIGTSRELPIVRRVESVMFLRNVFVWE